MLRYFTITTLLLLLCGCGNKHGGNSTSSNTDTNSPTTGYSLSGRAYGLTGNLVLVNGEDTSTISSDNLIADKDGNLFAPIHFIKPMSKGTLYDVKIVALPKDQLCELRASKNYIYRDRQDLVVECATLSNAQVQVTTPANYQLGDLRLLSNFQGLGGQGETPLTDSTATIALFKNSVLSLRNSKNEILFLSYVTDPSQPIRINSQTTAAALMLLEPTIVSAMHDRGSSVGVLANDLATIVNTDGDLDKLASSIQTLIDTGGNLTNPQQALSAPLAKVLSNAATILTSIALPDQSTVVAASSTVKQNKLTVVNPAVASGVAFDFSKEAGADGSLTLTATNNFQRFVSLSSSRFSSTLISPLGNKGFDLPTGLGSQKSIDITIIGPGMQGVITTGNTQQLLEATEASGINQYFFPSLSELLGVKDSSQFNVGDCLSTTSITNLQNNSSSLPLAADNLNQKKYYRLFSDIAFKARGLFSTPSNGNPSPYLEEMFSCAKFGYGVLISTKKAIAIENTGGILQALNAVFNPATLEADVDLFNNQEITLLSSAINNSFVEKNWTLSNVLQLDITADKNRIAEGDTISLSASCSNPITKSVTECTVNWDFGNDKNGTGSSANTTYPKAGSYKISATAMNSDGAQQTQTLTIDVLPNTPNIEVSSILGKVASGTQAYDFGTIAIGNTASAIFTIANTGFIDLSIANITSANNNFVISATPSPTLGANKSTNFTVTFKPSTASSFESTITIASNDPDQNNFSFNVIGKAESRLGRWTVQDGNLLQSFAAARVSNVYDSTTNSLQIRLFAAANADYPQIRILLKNYDINANTQGNGTYSLDDVGGETCLGFFGKDGSELNQYCTATEGLSDSNKVTGTATISPTTVSRMKKASFEFNARKRNCASCAPLHILGDLQYVDNL